jgi:S1-C subfamily serine protease
VTPRRALLALPLAAGCARLPAEQARGTPAGTAAAQSFATLLPEEAGAPLGSAVGVAPGIAATAAHTLGEARHFRLARGDGAPPAPARLIARVPEADLAFLATDPGLLAPLPFAPHPAEAGQRVWAVGAPRLGPGLAQGEVALPNALLPGYGLGFTAKIGALMGYSGGPVLDSEGRLLGLTSALTRPGPALALASLSGADLDGLARGASREVFVLGAPGIAAALASLDLGQGRHAAVMP